LTLDGAARCEPTRRTLAWERTLSEVHPLSPSRRLMRSQSGGNISNGIDGATPAGATPSVVHANGTATAYALSMAPRRQRVFMVRMWLPEELEEPGERQVAGVHRHGPSGEWRGSVRDVTAERTYYVVGTREIADYIASALSCSEPTLSS
jgi:hypothetical protein